MTQIVAGLTTSLDGYVNDRHGSVDALYPDFEAMHQYEPMIESIQSTGAVVMGRRAFEMAEDPDWFSGNYEYQVPIFVLTHRPLEQRPKEGGGVTFTFVTDGIASAVTQARRAAGEKDVTIIGGPETIRQALAAGLVDELHIDIMPVLLGGGQRLFDASAEPLTLERIQVVALPAGRTFLRYRVGKTGDQE